MSALDRLVERTLDWTLEVGLYALVGVAIVLSVVVAVVQITQAVTS